MAADMEAEATGEAEEDTAEVADMEAEEDTVAGAAEDMRVGTAAAAMITVVGEATVSIANLRVVAPSRIDTTPVSLLLPRPLTRFRELVTNARLIPIL